MSEIFLDSSFAIALASPSDEHHDAAAAHAIRIGHRGDSLITTMAVLLEIGNALSRPPNRAFAVNILAQAQQDPDTVIVHITEQLFNSAFDMYSLHTDKTWGLVDCISFIVMQERGITEALTADRHFVQAGFRALLLEDG